MTSIAASLRVLLVEDHPTLLDLLGQMVELLGHKPLTAACIHDALAIDPDGYDLVLCDYRLPDGEATALLSALRQRGCDAPMILLTAYDTATLTDAEAQGFAALLTKPLDMQDLGRILDRTARTGMEPNAPAV